MIFAAVSFGSVRHAIAAVALVAGALAGCARSPADPTHRAALEQTDDPLEPMNRKILATNMVFDKFLLRPVAKVYITVLPERARDALHRVLENLKEPVIVVDNVLQGRLNGAGISLGRFAVNTTIGFGGVADVAKKWGLDKQPADFGQTLYVWKFPEGPYLVLPILGPSNPRDAIGMGVDAVIDPLSYFDRFEHVNSLQIGRFVLGGIDRRARVIDVLDDLQKNSLDFYAQLKSLSEQQRAVEVERIVGPQPGANFYNEPGKDEPGKANPAPAPVAAPAPPRNLPPTPPSAPAAPGAAAADTDEGPLRGAARP